MIARELKEKLRNRQTQIGTFVKLADPTALEVLGLAGMDFAIIDTEHAPCDQMLLLDMIRAADSVGLPTIVRVPEGTEPHILKALDIGASGVQIPGLSTVEEIREAVSFTKYAPRGVRGLSFAQRSAGYGTKEKFQYMQDSNDGLINVVHIENKDAAARVEELCALEDIDVLFIGPMDISQSLGHPGDPGHEDVQKVVHKVIDVCNSKGKSFGIFVGTPEAAQKYMELGASYIALASDLAFMRKGYQAMTAELKK